MTQLDGELRRFFTDSLRKAAAAGGDLDAALVEVGWPDALSSDPQLAISVLFELQGEANATSSALNAVLRSALGVTGAVLVPIGPAPVIDSGRVAFRGFLTAPAESIVVPAEDIAVSVAVGAVSTRTVRGLDPSLGLVEVSGVVEADAVPLAGAWSDAVAAGQLALAYELIGASSAMLRLAVEHARSREQGGRFIAGFQAIRHRLAESHVALEAARAAADTAWAFPGPWSSGLAKGIAGTSARTVAQHAQQVLAGIGFTTEHPFHRYLRRVRVLDQLLGSSAELTRQLGEQLLAARTLPAPLPL